MKRNKILLIGVLISVASLVGAGYYSWLADVSIDASVGPTYYWDGSPAEDVIVNVDLELYGGDTGEIGNYSLMLNANATGSRTLPVAWSSDDELGFEWIVYGANYGDDFITLYPNDEAYVVMSYNVSGNATTGDYSASWYLTTPN